MATLIFIIIILVLILVHEFGHFITAKLSGIRVDEFGIGFPPRAIVLKKKGETIYTLNWIPFGGFVKIFGEDPDEDSLNGPDHKRSMIAKPKLVQAAVLIAGVVANVLLAWVLVSGSYMIGVPASLINPSAIPVSTHTSLLVTDVIPESPAAVAGIESGDHILSITSGLDTLNNPTPDLVQDFVRSHGIELMNIVLLRGNNDIIVTLTPKVGIIDNTTPTIGVNMELSGKIQLPFFSAISEGLKTTFSFMGEIASSLWQLIKSAFIGKASLAELTGPIGIISIVGDAYRFGFVSILWLTALISANLAIINILPFPALDGGRLLFLLIERIKGSRINPKISNTINTIGFILLIALMIVVTIHDVKRLL